MGRCTRSRAIVRVIAEVKPGREGTEGEGGHREEIITTETQRTRSSDTEWEMVLSFCILDFSVTPCSLCLCGNKFPSVPSFSL
ncbi:MAG: hypothetical protein QOE88_111 [Verrucomicrobiota bacterium]|nr:hypothetical protein [Verrucomicrobiota bacterium]